MALCISGGERIDTRISLLTSFNFLSVTAKKYTLQAGQALQHVTPSDNLAQDVNSDKMFLSNCRTVLRSNTRVYKHSVRYCKYLCVSSGIQLYVMIFHPQVILSKQ